MHANTANTQTHTNTANTQTHTHTHTHASKHSRLLCTQYCQQNLPSYAVPMFVRVLPEMQVTATFKHQKVKCLRVCVYERGRESVCVFVCVCARTLLAYNIHTTQHTYNR